MLKMGTDHQELSEKRKGPFVLFMPEVSMKAGITDIEKRKIPTLAARVIAQSHDANCCTSFTFIATPNARSSVDSNGVLVTFS